MTFMRVTSCLSIMKTGRVGGKHPTIDLLIGTCWLAPFFSSRAHVNSPALTLLVRGQIQGDQNVYQSFVQYVNCDYIIGSHGLCTPASYRDNTCDFTSL